MAGLFLLQASALFDFVPDWLGPAIVFFGVQLILLGAMQKSLSEAFPFWSQLNGRESTVVITGLALGFLFVASSVLQRYNAVRFYAILLFCLGRIIEGAASVRFYKKILHLIRYEEFQGDTRQRLKRYLVLFFVLIVSGWAVIRILEDGPFYGSTIDSIKLVWTLLTLFIATFGISYKLRFADDVFNRGMKFGFILCVGGAEIFNMTVLLDYLSFVSGTIAYSLGFWSAFILLVKSERHRREPLFG